MEFAAVFSNPSSSSFLVSRFLKHIASMGDVTMKQIFVKPIQLADQLTKSADNVQSFKQDCLELKSKSEKLAALLRQAAQSSSDFYKRPTLQIIEKTEKTLCESLSLVQKCRCVNILMKPTKCCFPSSLMKRISTIIVPEPVFKEAFFNLEILISDVTWLVGVSVSSRKDRMSLGFPSISHHERVICLIWEEIHTLCEGTIEDKSDAAAYFVSLSIGNNDRYKELIIQEGGVKPLLELLEEGRIAGQENVVEAIGFLGFDPQSVEQIIQAGACKVFEKILKEKRPIEVQSMVAWAVAELVAEHPNCQDDFAQSNIVQFLVSHLAFECENSATKVSMAAKALRKLAKGNSAICSSINKSGGILSFAVLLEKAPNDEIQSNSALALMEIAAVAEEDSELRWAAFNPNTPAGKAVFDQLIRVLAQADSDDLLITCIEAVGYLARTFQATSTRIVELLVKWLKDEEDEHVQNAAVVALSKFVETRNSSHLRNSRAIISARGVVHLVQIVYFGYHALQISALILLSNIALQFPDSEELKEIDLYRLLIWAAKQENITRDPGVGSLMSEAISQLKIHQYRITKGIPCWSLKLTFTNQHQDNRG